MSPKFTMGRRAFLTSSVLASGAAALAGRAGAAVAPAKAITLSNAAIPTRVFGRTGLTLPIFGHGGSALIDNDASIYGVTLPPQEARVQMVRRAYDQGVRYFDTARIYRESEPIMGEALKDVRENVFLASKVMVPAVEKVRESVEKSLETLGMDYVDSMQIHGPMIERLDFDVLMAQHAELVKMRDEGLIRYIGLTGHSRFEKMHQLIATGAFDTVLIEFGYFKKGYNTRHSNSQSELRELCVAEAHKQGMGIVAMKVMSANVYSHNAKALVPDYDEAKRAKLPAAAIRWVANDPRVHILNLGISLPDDLDKNLATFAGDLTLTEEDRLLLAEFAAKAYESEYVKGLEMV